jgi:6-phosphofructokinase
MRIVVLTSGRDAPGMNPATPLGAAAVDCVARRQAGVLVGLLRGEVWTPLSEVARTPKSLDSKLLKLAEILAM